VITAALSLRAVVGRFEIRVRRADEDRVQAEPGPGYPPLVPIATRVSFPRTGATSVKTVEIVRSALTAGSRGDREAGLGFADHGIVIDATRRVFNPMTYVGIEGARRWFADMDEVWEQFRFESAELIDAGDRVVVIGRLVGKGKASGIEVEQPIAVVWTVRDGRIVRGEIGYADRRKPSKPSGCGSSPPPRLATGRQTAYSPDALAEMVRSV
jgi:ketosteroid isomerase-like protein